MALYIKKPIAIEAFRYEGDLKACGKYCVPDWAVKAYESGVMYYKANTQGELYILTLEGEMHAPVGCYIIQGVNGELYPCKQDIFEKTYEAVETVD